jgi:hypothetical protein
LIGREKTVSRSIDARRDKRRKGERLRERKRERGGERENVICRDAEKGRERISVSLIVPIEEKVSSQVKSTSCPRFYTNFFYIFKFRRAQSCKTFYGRNLQHGTASFDDAVGPVTNMKFFYCRNLRP